MKLSTDRILTTHVGSLPRPEPLLELLQAQLDGASFEEKQFAARSAEAVRDAVARQVAAGIDVVSDGEMSKISYAHYVKHRLNGVTERGDAHDSIPGTAPNTDMVEHLEPHDTLEATFQNTVFWKGATTGVKNGFKDWIMGAIQAYGMLKGQRYALFENEKASDHFLLFGIGVGEIGGEKDLVEMVSFVKPFTRKAGYLLEIRKRDISDPDEYHAELRHYLMPFLFAFDSMRDFKLNGELLSFFTSNY